MDVFNAVIPWVTALELIISLPSRVLGPMDFAPFCRFAASTAGVIVFFFRRLATPLLSVDPLVFMMFASAPGPGNALPAAIRVQVPPSRGYPRSLGPVR